MSAKYVQVGDSIDYTPEFDVDAGEVVVQGDLAGVAKLDIEGGVLGALAVAGVFDFPKDVGSASAIAVGAKVYWDDGLDVATTVTGENVYIGKVVRAAADEDETVRVRMSQ